VFSISDRRLFKNKIFQLDQIAHNFSLKQRIMIFFISAKDQQREIIEQLNLGHHRDILALLLLPLHHRHLSLNSRYYGEEICPIN
jgi:hypothetical protein